MKVWMLCEAFTLTEDPFGHQQTVHKSLTPWALPYKDRRTVMRELRMRVRERVLENYEGRDDADDYIRRDIDEVMSKPERPGRGKWQYNYSASDREVVWRVYPCEVVR